MSHKEECTHDESVLCINCGTPIIDTPVKVEINPSIPGVEWENGRLTFDDVEYIMDKCNVKDVTIKQDSLIISFVPKDATGKVWEALKEKMHQITGK